MHQLIHGAERKNEGKRDEATGQDVDQTFWKSSAQQSVDGGTGGGKQRYDPNELQKVHSSPKTRQREKTPLPFAMKIVRVLQQLGQCVDGQCVDAK